MRRGRRLPTTDDGWDELARDAVQRAAGRPALTCPGLGHPSTKTGDPRTPCCFRDRSRGRAARPAPAAVRGDRPGPPRDARPTLPLNGAGACGAALCDLGFPCRDPARVRRCSRGQQVSSATSPRRCGDRSAWTSTTTSTEATTYTPPSPEARLLDDLDPEEQVQVPLGQAHVAADRAGVAAAERGQHQAAGVELDAGGQARRSRPARRPAPPAHRDPVVAGVAAGDPDPDRERLGDRVGRGRCPARSRT